MIDDLIAKYHKLTGEHEPGDLVTVPIDDITTFCKALNTCIPVLSLLQGYLSEGATINYQNDKWWIFDKEGHSVIWGNTIRTMLLNLILHDEEMHS